SMSTSVPAHSAAPGRPPAPPRRSSDLWAGIAREVYRLTGHDPTRVTPVSTDEYYADAAGPVAPRPRNSLLDLSKIESTGLTVRRSEEHTSELQSREKLVCRLLLEKTNT